MNKNRILKNLQSALRWESGEKTEEVIFEICEFGLDKDFTPFLVELLDSDWHFKHEDIVQFMQELGDERATQILLKKTLRKFDYLVYDNSYPLSRKCTWALADIGTDESKNALIQISTNEDDVIRGYAQKRLDNWDNEIERKKAANNG